jgi:hypothetical protein
MFKVFFVNIYVYIEYTILYIIFASVLYNKREMLLVKFAYRYGLITKIVTIIAFIIISTVFFIICGYLNIHWSLGIAFNAMISSIALFLMVSLYIKKK